MSALNNGWIKIETTSGSGTTAIAVEVLEKNTGRTVSRSETIVGTNAHGVTATATIKQDPKGAFAIIDHIEKHSDGTTVTSLDDNTAAYDIVGYSNFGYIDAEEEGGTSCTDINSNSGEARTNGIAINDGDTEHTGVALGEALAYGTEHQYTFKIPFVTESNSGTSRNITITIFDDSEHSASITIEQDGTQEA